MTFDVMMLAGGLRPSPIQLAVGFPAPGLPIGTESTLLSTWLDRIAAAGGGSIAQSMVVCGSNSDFDWIAAEVRRCEREAGTAQIMLDPRAHRGTCGVVADALEGSGASSEWVLVVELTALPPRSLDPALELARNGADSVVGVSRDEQPSGVYLFRRESLKHCPRVGYFDLKEQFIDRLVANGVRIDAVELSSTVARLTDRRNYLRGIRIRQSEGAESSDSGVGRRGGNEVAGFSLVCHGAEVDPTAFVIDSVVMPGAKIGRGVVIARSVIGPLMEVPEGSIVVESTLADPAWADRAAMARTEGSRMSRCVQGEPTWSTAP